MKKKEWSVGQHLVCLLKMEEHVKPRMSFENGQDGAPPVPQHTAAGSGPSGTTHPDWAQELPWHPTGATAVARERFRR